MNFRHPIPRSGKPIKRSPVKKVNPKRRAKAFEQAYLSGDRALFVRNLKCAACGEWGFAVNAHLLGNDGARRKGHYTTVGPLCGSDVWGPDCHYLYDNDRSKFNARFPDFDPIKVAAETEELWLSSLGSAPGEES